jgi:hypothetical protein
MAASCDLVDTPRTLLPGQVVIHYRRLAVRPWIGGDVFRYRLHSPDGDDLGEATYAVMIRPGEEILVGNGRRLRVLDVVPFDEKDKSPFVGLLQVEAV